MPAFQVIDADKIAQDLYSDPAFVAKVFKTFGMDGVVAEDGKSIDRSKLDPKVFADPEKRKKMNSLIHMPITL